MALEMGKMGKFLRDFKSRYVSNTCLSTLVRSPGLENQLDVTGSGGTVSGGLRAW